MANCKKCVELLSILKEVKNLMDSETYIDDFDKIYDKISNALNQDAIENIHYQNI